MAFYLGQDTIVKDTVMYMDINSNYRDRERYPNPGDFIVHVAQSGMRTSGLTAYDPIINSYPIIFSTVQAGSTATEIVVSGGINTTQNFYSNMFLQKGVGAGFSQLGVPIRISSYNGSTFTFTLSSSYPTPVVVGENVVIRRELPMVLEQFQAGSTNTSLVLSLTGPDIVPGTRIHILTTNNLVTISSYDSATKTATITSYLSVVPAIGEYYELLVFSRDNFSPMIHSGKSIIKPIMMEVQLLKITIPHADIKNGYGNVISNYPYVYVHMQNTDTTYKNVLSSNNPHAYNVLFKVPTNNSTPIRTAGFSEMEGKYQFQTIQFNPNDNIRFRVILPNGEVIKFVQDDNFSPLLPNPSLQISVLFGLKFI